MNFEASSVTFRYFLCSAITMASEEHKYYEETYYERQNMTEEPDTFKFTKCTFRDMMSEKETGSLQIGVPYNELNSIALLDTCYFVNLTHEFASAFDFNVGKAETKNCYYYWTTAGFRYSSFSSTCKDDQPNSHTMSTFVQVGHRPMPSISHGCDISNGAVVFKQNNWSRCICKEENCIGEMRAGSKLEYAYCNHRNCSGRTILNIHVSDQQTCDIHDCTFSMVGSYQNRFDNFLSYSGPVVIREWYFEKCKQFYLIGENDHDTLTLIDCETDLPENKVNFGKGFKLKNENFKYGVDDLDIPNLPESLPEQCWTHIPSASPKPPTESPSQSPSASPNATPTIPPINDPGYDPVDDDNPDFIESYQQEGLTTSDIIQLGGLGVLLIAVTIVFILNARRKKAATDLKFADETQFLTSAGKQNGAGIAANHA